MFFMKLLGLRIKRHVFGKEVIIEEPKYTEDAQRLEKLNSDIYIYNKVHELKKLPNFINVFFKYQPDNEIERISDELENVIEDLTNTRNKVILHNLNLYPPIRTPVAQHPCSHHRTCGHRTLPENVAIQNPTLPRPEHHQAE